MADNANTEAAKAAAEQAKADAARAAEAGGKRPYVVLRALKHDGKLYLPAADGSVQVALTDSEADELKAVGAIGDSSKA